LDDLSSSNRIIEEVKDLLSDAFGGSGRGSGWVEGGGGDCGAGSTLINEPPIGSGDGKGL
jgi:hypothetical protein